MKDLDKYKDIKKFKDYSKYEFKNFFEKEAKEKYTIDFDEPINIIV